MKGSNNEAHRRVFRSRESCSGARDRNRITSLSFGGDSGLGGCGRMDRPSGVGPAQKGSSAMMWRHLCLVRAWSAAGLLGGLMVLGASIAAAQTPAASAAGSEPSAPPVEVATATVDLLQASKSG